MRRTYSSRSPWVGALSMSLACCALVALAGCGDVIEPGPGSVTSGLTDDDKKLDEQNGNLPTELTFDVPENLTGPRVELEPTKTGDDTFELRLLLRDFPNLFGIAGHLRYDPAALEVTEIEKHTVLEGTGYASRTIAADKPKGRLLLGSTRFRTGGSFYSQLQGADVNKQRWVTLQVKVLQEGAHTIAFDPHSLMAKRSTYENVKTNFGQLTVVWKGSAK